MRTNLLKTCDIDPSGEILSDVMPHHATVKVCQPEVIRSDLIAVVWRCVESGMPQAVQQSHSDNIFMGFIYGIAEAPQNFPTIFTQHFCQC